GSATDQAPRALDFTRKGNLERDAAAGDALQKGAQVAHGAGPVAERKAQLAQHELTVALAARGVGQALAELGQVGHGFAGGEPREAEAGQIQRLVARAPARGPSERAASVGIATLEIEDAAERPQVKGATRWRAHAAADAQVLDGLVTLAQAQASARGILARDI